MDDFLAQSANEIFQSDDALADAFEPIVRKPRLLVHCLDDSSDECIVCEVIDVDMSEPNKSEDNDPVLPEAKVVDGIHIVCSKPTPHIPHRPAIMNVNGENSCTIDKSKTPADAFLESVTFTVEELDHTNENSVYSKMTRERLSAVRREEYVDLNLIRTYADNIVLKHRDAGWSQEEYLDRLQALHNELLFSNPLKVNKSMLDGKFRFAVPPGMTNLGATCYLNTQLQCLARNIAFLGGIFSWRPSKTTTRMDSVLSTLQLVMSRLAYGAEATSSTEEFSRALGLQNDEMQDPNEFARLLFQRMHEAFQSSQFSTNGEQSLPTLLPTLFEGDVTYETRCQTCGRVTERIEKFMDINVPIVHPATTLANTCLPELQLPAANKENETTVQYCLDTYMCSEELRGDNQYWCENCATKRDATRQVVFGTLPPLLNLQLCRYVYDRQKQTKKKLTDEVLLPQCLNVKSNQFSESVTYRLCAVMKHLGNSAYQGHYIAESMDWQTGIWFEFDDDKVSILENGPSCCPQDADTTKRQKRKGSRDAYNMYYVQESFLGRCAANSMVDRGTEQHSCSISQLELERQAEYNMLSK
jgi:ubiquitin C-terminal hydrolase